MTNYYSLNLPDNTDLPFFDYGIFKPGQIAYSRIKEYEKESPKECTVKHKMFLRDGVPFILKDPNEISSTEGFLFKFQENESENAYKTISETVSKKLYYWKKIDVRGESANALIGRSPSKSRPEPIGSCFDGRNDPYFKGALDLIRDDLDEKLNPKEIKDYFKLQRNYILLWAAVERYCSLKYGPRFKTKINEKLASEWIFQESLRCHVPLGKTRHIYRTDTLDKLTLDCNNPEESIAYYYTIRCNIAHRGKGSIDDFDIVRNSLEELLKIFNDVVEYTFR